MLKKIRTKIVNVAFHPPSICLLGSNPLASLSWSEECHTFVTIPPGTPSYDWPFGVLAIWLSQLARAVAVADWRGILKCKVRKERNRSHASNDPIILPMYVLLWCNLDWDMNCALSTKIGRLTPLHSSSVLTTRTPQSKSECPPKYFVPWSANDEA